MEKILFATSNYQYMKNLIYDNHNNREASFNGPSGTPRLHDMFIGEAEVTVFSDQELYHKLGDVTEKSVIIIGGTNSAEETLELFDIACHCAKNRAHDLTLV